MYKLQPSQTDLESLIKNTPNGNIVPVYLEISADLLTPTAAYLKLSKNSDYSFLFESVSGNEKIGRFSFLGSNPYHLLKSGEEHEIKGDPLIAVEDYLKQFNFVEVANLPSFTGGAIGYVSFDCIKYFEPRTDKKVEDNLKLPESLHMFCDDLVIFDHLYQIIRIVTHIKGDIQNPSYLADQYKLAQSRLEKIADTLVNAPVELPVQKPIKLGNEYSENCDQERYEGFVRNLQSHIVKGDIIQAVPSRRLARPTDLHPFNVYRHLRQVNPAPYLFFLDCKDFQVVGASPEMLVKVDSDRKVYTHPIAGTRKRGKTEEEDLALEKDLLSDRKEIAEHTMLVDLGRNDVNRICKPTSTKVDSLMHIEKYSHVMHIVSNVSGILRDDQTPFDAFRSIFPAGTVSGAPKVKAIELIRELEGETRGVYAGSVGHFDYSGTIDTCIAIRTMLFKDGVAYLQAGGGIVHHSNPEDEYHETVNKLNSNVATLAKAESYYANQ